jgi:hypothetical protein
MSDDNFVTHLPNVRNPNNFQAQKEITPFDIDVEKAIAVRKAKTRASLSRTVYNRDYVIGLITTILLQIEKNKLSPDRGMHTIRDSCEKLLAMIEVDKDNESLQ